VQYLQDPGHHGVLREDIDGEREELQKELDLMRKHSSMSLKRFREIESVFKRGAFALVDASDALGKSKRDASISLLSAFTQKERATIMAGYLITPVLVFWTGLLLHWVKFTFETGFELPSSWHTLP
jgi:hypothetical protein